MMKDWERGGEKRTRREEEMGETKRDARCAKGREERSAQWQGKEEGHAQRARERCAVKKKATEEREKRSACPFTVVFTHTPCQTLHACHPPCASSLPQRCPSGCQHPPPLTPVPSSLDPSVLKTLKTIVIATPERLGAGPTAWWACHRRSCRRPGPRCRS